MKNSLSLSDKITQIELRNKKVEAEKAWETSLTRKITITALTYLVIGLFMSVIGVSDPWINAIIPSLGFILSTMTVPFFKSLWLKYIYHQK